MQPSPEQSLMQPAAIWRKQNLECYINFAFWHVCIASTACTCLRKGLGDKYSLKLIQVNVDLCETACEAHLGRSCENKGSEILRQCAAHIMATSKLPTSMWQDKK